MKRLLILDANYLCHRAFYALRNSLSFEELPTSVAFGFLRDITTFQDTHNTSDIVFCFDSSTNLRKDEYGGYKASRAQKRADATSEERHAYAELRAQINNLQFNTLPDIGFRNIFCADGYEADDCIASVVGNLCRDTQAILVCSDHDMLQLLGKRVLIWNPRSGEAVTANSFRANWGIEPSQFADVKAIAGCSSDDVPGVRGVGEKTAAKFLRGELKRSSKKFQDIVKNQRLLQRNLNLVRLPYAGCPTFELRQDKVTRKKWEKVTRALGMTTLEPPEDEIMAGRRSSNKGGTYEREFCKRLIAVVDRRQTRRHLLANQR